MNQVEGKRQSIAFGRGGREIHAIALLRPAAELMSRQILFGGMAMTRYEEASTVPFRSMHAGRRNTRDESFAVNQLQERLKTLETFGIQVLPTRLLARRGPNSPPSGYGPFVFGQETVLGGRPHFGRLTEIAVKKFQSQVNVEEDGKAGMITLGKLNERFDAIMKALAKPKKS